MRDIVGRVGLPRFSKAVTIGPDLTQESNRCEGFHAGDELAQLHVQGFVNGICQLN